MNKTDMKTLKKGLPVHGRMKQSINLPMQGISFAAGESVIVTPYPGSSTVLATGGKLKEKSAKMSLYQVEQFIK